MAERTFMKKKALEEWMVRLRNTPGKSARIGRPVERGFIKRLWALQALVYGLKLATSNNRTYITTALLNAVRKRNSFEEAE